MKRILKFGDYDRINEEWMPSGPYMSLKEDPKGSVVEFYDIDESDNRCGIKFIHGNEKDHAKSVLNILGILKDSHYVTDKFTIHGVDDCKISEVRCYVDNLKGSDMKKFTKDLEKLGTVSVTKYDLVVNLNQEIIIDVPDSEEKLELKFSKKLDRLCSLLEDGSIERTPENEKLVDTLISRFKIDIEDD
jgi:hypothetical protein